jgi:DNA-binding Xre family transcriptional regulator
MRGAPMRISYNKLWKMLIDKKMNRKDLRMKSGISTASLAKLGKGENITTDVLLKICEAMNCDITEIMEIDPDSLNETPNGQ